VVITRAKPARNVLVNERLQAARRLSVLLADMDGIDQSGDDRLVEMRAEVSAILARIATLDEQLAACATTPIDKLIEAQQQEAVTPRQKRQAARGRLQAVMLVLDGLPPSCVDAAKLLRKAVKSELKKIEASRREEFPSCD
jgi:hypothetical protein